MFRKSSATLLIIAALQASGQLQAQETPAPAASIAASSSPVATQLLGLRSERAALLRGIELQESEISRLRALGDRAALKTAVAERNRLRGSLRAVNTTIRLLNSVAQAGGVQSPSASFDGAVEALRSDLENSRAAFRETQRLLEQARAGGSESEIAKARRQLQSAALRLRVATHAVEQLERRREQIVAVVEQDASGVPRELAGAPIGNATPTDGSEDSPATGGSAPAAVMELIAAGASPVGEEAPVAAAPEPLQPAPQVAAPVPVVLPPVQPAAAVAESPDLPGEARRAVEAPAASTALALPAEEPASPADEPAVPVAGESSAPAEESAAVEQPAAASEEPAAPLEELAGPVAEAPVPAAEEPAAPVDDASEPVVEESPAPAEEVAAVEEPMPAAEEPAAPVDGASVPVVGESPAPGEELAAVEPPAAASEEPAAPREELAGPVAEALVPAPEEPAAPVDAPSVPVAEAPSAPGEELAAVEEPMPAAEEPAAPVDDASVPVVEESPAPGEELAAVEPPAAASEEPAAPLEDLAGPVAEAPGPAAEDPAAGIDTDIDAVIADTLLEDPAEAPDDPATGSVEETLPPTQEEVADSTPLPIVEEPPQVVPAETDSTPSADTPPTATIPDERIVTGEAGSGTSTSPAPEPVIAGYAVLRWTIPVTRANGAPLAIAELRGYEIYVISESTGERTVITIDDPLREEHRLDGLPPDTWHFAVAAIDTAGNASELSAVVSKTIADTSVASNP